MFHYFMAVAKRCGADILDRQAGGVILGSPAVCAGQPADLRAAAQRAGHEPHPRRLHGGRRHRPRPVPLLPLDRRQPQAALRPTETCAAVCLQPDREIKFDSVGKPAPRVEVKIADNGEVLVRGKLLLKEYYKRPDATAEVIDAEGYFHTGDAGFFDEDGHLKIIDRAKDVGKLANGAMFAPNYIENKLKFFPHIKEAVCFGHDRDMVCAFINIDMGAVGNWAERRGLPYSGYTDLAASRRSSN
jgi:long-chain acyl-CoA synthetase